MDVLKEHEHSFRLLDFYRLRERTAEYCQSQEGRAALLESLPVVDRVILERLDEDIRALVVAMERADTPSRTFPDISAGVRKLSVEGTVLEIEDLLALGMWAGNFDALSALLAGFRLPYRSLGAEEEEALEKRLACGFDPSCSSAWWAEYSTKMLLDRSPKLQGVYKTIFEIITPEGEIRDLPELRRIRDSIARANKDLVTIADSYRNDGELRQALQSGEPTQRDGRTVLAVKANFRGRVKGIVHEVSATGQTVFVEPVALVDKNNELVQLTAKLASEILRILRETTENLRKYRDMLVIARNCLGFLDMRLARAVQCRREELQLAETCERGITLWRARHPLLGARAVPIDVDIPDDTRTLIVTGPNTGGKTVTLKTLGLFALLHQFAVGLRVAQGSSFPIFDGVYADIGDEQSIDQSLSTFSGHMKVISGIVRDATSRSLVLMDELGAGTDPEEGCAIAMGLLDHFIERGSLTIATTHHGILKNYGYTRPGCLNASMEFDSTKLAPTYRIVMGVPGESRAIEIAGQTGLEPAIVEKARHYLDEERTDVAVLIRGLSEKHRELELLERERRARLKEAAEDQRKADLAVLRVRQKEMELKKHGVAELNRLLSESRKTLENLVRELRESGISTDRTKEVKEFIASLADSVTAGQKDIRAEEERHLPAAPQKLALEKGAEAVIRSTGKKARLLRAAGPGTWLVEVGSVRLTVRETDLSPAESGAVKPPSYDVELNTSPGEPGYRASFELDLRGYRLQDALSAVERQIDAASLQGLTLFSIIHGTGEGILGAGIHGYLKSSPVVADYHFSRPEEGGYGKTIVRLKV